MNWDQIEGKWKQFVGSARQRWAKLTDDDIGLLHGKRHELEGRLQERYGWNKEQTQKEVDDWMKTHQEEPSHVGRP